MLWVLPAGAFEQVLDQASQCACCLRKVEHSHHGLRPSGFVWFQSVAIIANLISYHPSTSPRMRQGAICCPTPYLRVAVPSTIRKSVVLFKQSTLFNDASQAGPMGSHLGKNPHGLLIEYAGCPGTAAYVTASSQLGETIQKYLDKKPCRYFQLGAQPTRHQPGSKGTCLTQHLVKGKHLLATFLPCA